MRQNIIDSRDRGVEPGDDLQGLGPLPGPQVVEGQLLQKTAPDRNIVLYLQRGFQQVGGLPEVAGIPRFLRESRESGDIDFEETAAREKGVQTRPKRGRVPQEHILRLGDQVDKTRSPGTIKNGFAIAHAALSQFQRQEHPLVERSGKKVGPAFGVTAKELDIVRPAILGIDDLPAEQRIVEEESRAPQAVGEFRLGRIQHLQDDQGLPKAQVRHRVIDLLRHSTEIVGDGFAVSPRMGRLDPSRKGQAEGEDRRQADQARQAPLDAGGAEPRKQVRENDRGLEDPSRRHEQQQGERLKEHARAHDHRGTPIEE